MKKYLFAFLAFLTAPVSALTVTTTIGKVRIEGSSGGLSYITKEDNSAFAGCSNESNIMYITPSFGTDQKVAFLSFFLTAKSTGANVLIWYSVDGSGYCRMSDAEIQQ